MAASVQPVQEVPSYALIGPARSEVEGQGPEAAPHLKEEANKSAATYGKVFPSAKPPLMGTFTNNGTSMATYRWQCSSGAPTALVVLVHGFGEHLGRYGHVANFFTDCGYNVIGIDHICHGLSDGMAREKGRLDSFDDLVDNWRAFITEVVQKENLKTVVYAHSTGGLVAFLALAKSRWYTQWANFQGVILSAPLLRSPIGALYCCPKLLKSCLSCCRPSLAFDAVKGTDLTTYQPAVNATKEDPLYWGWKINFTFVRAMLAGSVEALSLLPTVDFSFLVMHSPEDTLCAPSGSTSLFEQAATPDTCKQIEVDAFAGSAHELHNEENWQKPLLFAHEFIQRGCRSLANAR